MKTSLIIASLLVLSLVGSSHAFVSSFSRPPIWPTLPKPFFSRSPFFHPKPRRTFRPLFEPSFFKSPFIQPKPRSPPMFPRFQRPAPLPSTKSMKPPVHITRPFEFAPKQKEGCEIMVQKTPKYSTQKGEGEMVVKISLPQVDKERLSLDLERNILKLRAPVMSVSVSETEPEVPGQVEEDEMKPEEPQGLVVTDVEEDEEEEGEKKEEKEVSVKKNKEQVVGRKNGCVEKHEYVLSLRIPQNINKELLSAHFEKGELFVHFPSQIPLNPSRPIPIQ